MLPFEHTQVLPDPINITRDMRDPNAVYSENTKKLFPQPIN